MAQNINHWCVVCGNGYHACDTCSEVKTFKPWRILTDTSEHYRIYMTIINFRDGLISKEKAKRYLSDIDLSNRKSFKPDIQAFLNQILDEPYKENKFNSKYSKKNFNSNGKKFETVVVNKEVSDDVAKATDNAEHTDDK